jgi:hypothetical protein
MAENFHIERVKRRTMRGRVKSVLDIDSMLLFNSFYILFGFIITGSLFAAAFTSFATHREYLEMLFVFAPASTAVWGIAYAAWNDKLRWAWNTLTAATTLALVGGIFVLLTMPGLSKDLMRELIICACASPALWTIIMGLRKIDW